ncbi:MAG TPA: leucine-rich repeat protein [Candidatus Mediterraneibacter stercoripullorum]|nr:leucine-rich repeat protein [Candidatus Mediterraneibacter stercoripullorum]
MKRKFLKQALGLVICLSMVCPQVMVSAAPLQEMNVKTIQAEVQSTSDDGNEQVTKVAEGLVTALIDGKAAEGESFQAAVEAAGINAADVETIEFQSGNVTSEDLAYIKENCEALETFKLNLTEELTFDAGVTVLPSRAFQDMESLETVELDGFTELGSYSLAETKSLANVSIPDVVKVGPYAFMQSPSDANTGKGGALKSINLPNVVTISNYAFSNCNALTEVNMPKVKSIDSNAFDGKNFTEIHLPDTIEKLARKAFYRGNGGAKKEIHVTIDKMTPPEITGNGTPFTKAAPESTLTVPEEALDAYMADTKWYDAEDHTWAGLKLPEQQTVVTANINGTSYNGASLEKAVEAAGLTAGDVTALTIESGKVTQDDLAYIKTLPTLKELTMNLGENLQLIGKDGNPTTVLSTETAVLEFAERTNGSTPKGVLQTLTLGGITEIQGSSLKSDSVKVINMPDVVTVGTSAFSGVPRVVDLDLSSAKVIGQSAFFNCTKLENLTLESVETLEKGSFRYTDSLKNLTLPATLKTIEDIEFGATDNGKKSSAKITMLGSTPPTVAYGAFDGVGSITSQATVTVPEGALQNYLDQIKDNLDAEGAIKTSDTYWNKLYLKEEGTYRIEFNAKNIAGGGDAWYAFVKAGSTPTEKQIPTAEAEEGYEFAGWNTKKDGSGDWITTETAITKDNIKVYPVFEEAVVNVTAEINGQSVGGETLEEAITASGIDAGDVTSIKFVSGNVTKEDLTYIKEECEDLEALTLNLTDGLTYENGSTVLPDDAFEGIRYLENVELGGFTEIGESAFQNSGIVSISIPDVTVINSQAFQRCTALESVDMPKVETIGSKAFYWTDSLEEVTLPASIVSLDECGFATPYNGTMNDFHLIIEKETPPATEGKIVKGEGTVTVPEGSLSAYLGETDFNKYFTSEGDVQWAGLYVEDPSYSMVTFHGTNAGQTAYAYVANDTAITEAQMPAFTKDGFVLAGWNTSEDGSGEALNVGDTLDGNMTVYAQWEEEVKDTTAPTAQISTGGKLQNIDQEKPYNINISLKFHDDTALDYYVLNGKEKPTGITGTWGDGNYQNIKSYLKEGNGEEGKNTLTVYDKAGNSTTYTFYVDQTKPELVGEFVITPDNGQMSTSKTVTFTISEPIQALEGWTEVEGSNGTQWQKEFTENFKGEIKFTDIAGNESDAYKLEVKRVENVKPEAEITYSNNGQPTNQDVVVTVKTNVECQTPDGWERVPGSAKRNEFQKTYSENTTETVTFVSLSGVSAEFEINVTGIDKVAPVITDVAISPENSQMSTSKTVTITADEAVQCPGEGWTEVEGSDGTQWAKVYTEAKKDSITVTDIAGNVSEKASFEVKRIENIAPTAEVAYSNDGQPTNEDVTVIISTNVECNVPDGWERVPGSAKRNQFQKTYSENTEETVTLTSLSGVTGSAVVTVTGIDKVAPEADVEYSTTEITSGSVIVTIRANEPIQTPEGWTKVDDVTFTKEYTHNVDRNVNIYDLAGNGNDVDIRITNIVQNKEVTVSYVDEATGETVGIETISVEEDSYQFNTSILQNIPQGYEIVNVGDTLINKDDNTAEVKVRIPADQAEAKLVIWWMDEWGIPLTDEGGEPWKMELTARGTEGEKHTFTKDDWELPEGYEYVSDTDKWLAEQDFIVKYGETLDTLSIAICPEGTSGVGR